MRTFIYLLHACTYDSYVIYFITNVVDDEILTFKDFEKAVADEFRRLAISSRKYKEITDKDYSHLKSHHYDFIRYVDTMDVVEVVQCIGEAERVVVVCFFVKIVMMNT